MAIKQNNKTQSNIRVNLSNILGLSEEQAKMIAQNQNRLRGRIAQTYFNGRNVGTETGGTNPTCTPCGGGGGGSGSGGSGSGGSGSGGSGSGGSGSGGGGVIIPCEECLTLSEAAEMTANGETPCCISGAINCETGESMPICLSENCGGGYGKGCIPPPYGGADTIVVSWWSHETQSNNYLITDMGSGAGVAATALQQSVDSYISGITICGEMSAGDKRYLVTCNKNGKTFKYWRWQRVNSEQCGFWYASCNTITSPSQSQYNSALANWKKQNGKYLINGKFYDACGISGEDCITVCDENGNQYKICANNGKPKITPIA